MAFEQFNTIQEMIEATYGRGSVLNPVAKADAPVISTTTGVFNAIFGAMAFNQLNMEANVFAALPKYPWQKSGYRAITADAGSTADGGTTEAATIPDTIKPTFAEVTVTLKEVVHTFDVSYKHTLLAKSGDDAFGTLAQLREYFAAKHAKAINQQLCVDGNTLAGANFESIDRVTASAAYATALSWTSADEDIYGIDRSGASWADAVVSHNSGTDRTLTLKLIEDTLASIKANGGRPNLIITGEDTLMRITSLAQSSIRYQGIVQQGQNIRIGVNGVETDEGMNFGLRVATVYGIPVIASNSVVKDTISRIYILDTTPAEGTGVPRLGIAIAQPTLYAESGMDAPDRNPFGINKLATQGLFYTAGELVCTFLAAQGSIRDLK